MRFPFVPSLCLASVLSGAVVIACSGPDPGEITFKDRKPTSGSTSSGATSSSSSSSSSGGDGGAGEGGTTSLIFPDAFPTTPPTAKQVASAVAGHAGKFGGGNNPAGVDCTTCHKTGGTAPQFVCAGTAYADSAGAAPLAGAQVRIVDSTGKKLAETATDKDGNFYCDEPATIAAGSKVGIRTSTKSGEMQTAIASGSCSTSACHGPLKIYPNK